MPILTALRDPIDQVSGPDALREMQLEIAECDAVQDVVARIIGNGYLAGSGAAWVINSNRLQLAVFSRQWKTPCFLVPPNSPILEWIFPRGRWQLYFSHLRNTDPEALYLKLMQAAHSK